MGQKLDTPLNKAGRSADVSGRLGRTGGAEPPVAVYVEEEEEEGDDDEEDDSSQAEGNSSYGTAPGNTCGRVGVRAPDSEQAEFIATTVSRDPRRREPMKSILARGEHPSVRTRGVHGGGVREGPALSPPDQGTVFCPVDTAQRSERTGGRKTRETGNLAIAGAGTTMEEGGETHRGPSGTGPLAGRMHTREPATSADPGKEEDSAVLEKDDTWFPSEGKCERDRRDESGVESRQATLQTELIPSDVDENGLPQAGGFKSSPSQRCAEKSNMNTRHRLDHGEGRKRLGSDTISVTGDCIEAHATSSTSRAVMELNASEVPGVGCQPEGANNTRAGHVQKHGGGGDGTQDSGEQDPAAKSQGQASGTTVLKCLSEEIHEGPLRTNRTSSKDMENTEAQSGSTGSPNPDGEVRHKAKEKSERLEGSLREAWQNKDNNSHPSDGRTEQRHEGSDRCVRSKFADAVSKRAREDVPGSVSLSQSGRQKENGEPLTGGFNSHPPLAQRKSCSVSQQVPDDPTSKHSLLLLGPLPEHCGGNRDEHIQTASLKKERHILIFSAMVTDPPSVHELPQRDASSASPAGVERDTSPITPGDTAAASGASREEIREKAKAKGPPPPVPKKPKNSLIKLRMAQLNTSEVKRRSKSRAEKGEKTKRRHTVDFHAGIPQNVLTNQDMCLFWDDMGTYTMPTSNVRRQSGDRHGEPGRGQRPRSINDRFRDTIDFDYCSRMEKLSPDCEPKNMDMLQEDPFVDRWRRRQDEGSPPPLPPPSPPPPPPVPRTPQKPLDTSETPAVPGRTEDGEVRPSKLPVVLKKRKVEPERGCDVAQAGSRDPRRAGERTDISGSRDPRRAGDHTDVSASSDHRRTADSTDVSGADHGPEEEAKKHDKGTSGSYKPVAELVKERNQLHQGPRRPAGAISRPEGSGRAQVGVVERSQSAKVSQMKDTFDVPKKPRRPVERPSEVNPPQKKGKAA